MAEKIEKIIETTNRLLDYIFSGVLFLVVLHTIREEYERNKETKDDIFIGTVVISSYNNSVLVLTNSIKPEKKSIHIHYLLNMINNSRCNIKPDIYTQLREFIPIFEKSLLEVKPVTDMTILWRDKNIGHLDRDHINNPIVFLSAQPIKWEEFENAYSIVSSGVSKIKEILEGGISFAQSASIAKADLILKTRAVYYLCYGAKHT